MTRDQLDRAQDLIATRDAIVECLSARDPESEFVQSYLTSKWNHERGEGKRLPGARYASLQIRGGGKLDEEDAITLAHWDILRDVLEAALDAVLPKVIAEIAALGVTT